jgi:hypothetical protein
MNPGLEITFGSAVIDRDVIVNLAATANLCETGPIQTCSDLIVLQAAH